MAIGLTPGQSDATKKLVASFLEARAKHLGERQKEFFLLADVQLDGRYEYIILWPMLLGDEIAHELAFTARQSAQISDWVRERENDTADRSTIEVVLEIGHDRVLSRYARYPWKSFAGDQQFATEDE